MSSNDDGPPRPGDGETSPDDATPGDASETPKGDGPATPNGDGGKRKAEKKKGRIRRHPIIASVLAFLLVVIAATGAWAAYLNYTIGSIDSVGLGSIPDEKRPPKVDNEALNILLAGVDKGDGRSIKQVVDDGWDPGVFRSDTVMILHVTADRDDAYLVSVPRDSYIRLYNDAGEFEQMNKVNAALAEYGPSAYVSTIEHLTGLRMDHLVMLDWQGFKDISTALGGVEVYIPETFYDSSQKRQWIEGPTTLEGYDALAYVRTRYDLPDESGDFGRIARQQNFMRAMLSKMLSQGTLANPLKLTNTIKAVVKNLTVDDEFTGGEIRNLALSMRGIHTEDLTFLTAPWDGYGEEVGSTVHLDKKRCDALWKAMADDNIDEYIDKYGNQDVLAGPKNVS